MPGLTLLFKLGVCMANCYKLPDMNADIKVDKIVVEISK